MNSTEDLHRAGKWIADTFDLLWTESEKGYGLRSEQPGGQAKLLDWSEVLDILMFGSLIRTTEIAMTDDYGEPTYVVTVSGDTFPRCVAGQTSIKAAMSQAVVAAVCGHLDSEGPNSKEEAKP